MYKKCNKCGKKSVWEDYTRKNFCESHFLGLVEKRVRKHIRVKKLIDINKQYFLEEKNNNMHLLTAYFLRRIFSDRLNFSQNGEKIFSYTIDDEAENLLIFFTKREELRNNKINILSVITDQEAKVLGEILGINLLIKEKNHSLLTNKDPQLLFSMIKSKNFLEKRIKK